MKRTFSILALSVLLAASVAAQDLKAFETNFNTFAGEMAPVLSYNATTGDIWSTAYIGNLPHFGAGLTFGFFLIPADALKPFFTAMGIELPAELNNGLPFPAMAVTAKLGGIILPFDLGVKGMVMFPELSTLVSSTGITADYTMLGATLRIPLLKENILLPAIAIGASYDYLSGSIKMPLKDMPTASYTFQEPNSGPTHTISVTDPTMALDFQTTSFDFTAQVSKKILFITPYVGAGISLGTSSVKGGLDARLQYDGSDITAANLQTIKDTLAEAGINVPDISAEGFRFGSAFSDPVIRLYGGLSFDLLFIYADVMGIYIPANGNLGANVSIRVQF